MTLVAPPAPRSPFRWDLVPGVLYPGLSPGCGPRLLRHDAAQAHAVAPPGFVLNFEVSKREQLNPSLTRKGKRKGSKGGDKAKTKYEGHV